MTAAQFNDTLRKLNLSVYAAAPILGLSLRQAQRYSAGEQIVSTPVANQLTLLVQMVENWRAERRKIIEQLKFFERPGARIGVNGKDETKHGYRRFRLGLRNGTTCFRPEPTVNPAANPLIEIGLKAKPKG